MCEPIFAWADSNSFHGALEHDKTTTQRFNAMRSTGNARQYEREFITDNAEDGAKW
jgi:hypothetical protein